VREEYTQHLIPLAQARGFADASIGLSLSVAEGGQSANLVIDCSSFKARGISMEDALARADEMSTDIVRGMTHDRMVADGVLRCTIG
jgi:hypothetical protein